MPGSATYRLGQKPSSRFCPEVASVVLALLLAALTLAQPAAATPSPAFVPNRGQADPQVRYEARAGDTAFFFTDRGATIALPGTDDRFAAPAFGAEGYALKLGFVGARPGTTVAAGPRAAGTVSYVGAAQAQRDLPTFSRLGYDRVWPGVDVSMSSGAGQLKYEFAVAAGADASAIGMAYAGATSLAVTPDGSLRVDTPRGPLTDTAPVAWQTIAGRRVDVPVRYRLRGGTRYGFALGAHDPSRPLTIDPGIVYSTFLGASGTDTGWAVAEDAAGNAYVASETKSSKFPTTAGAYDTTYNGGGDAVITKLAPDGKSLVYSTFIDLGGAERPKGIVVDEDGAAYLTGATGPTNPIDDAFVLKLAPSGAAVEWTRRLAGKAIDGGEELALDPAGNVYVVGQTASSDFPVTPGAYDTTFAAAGSKTTTDAFVTKLSPDGATRWSTFLGGSTFEISFGGAGIDVDGSGAPWVAFQSFSGDYPTTVGALDRSGAGGAVTRLAPDGGSLLYSTFLGAPGTDVAGLRLDPSGAVYVAGATSDAAFPTTAGAADGTLGGRDAFVTKLSPAGTLGYSTLVGGAGSETGGALDVDRTGAAYLTGFTNSDDFPTTPGAFDRSFDSVPGANGYPPGDAYVVQLEPNGSALRYATYLGGTEATENAVGLAVNDAQSVAVTGTTSLGADYPTTEGAFDRTFGHSAPYNNADAFTAKFDLGMPSAPTCDGMTATVRGTVGTTGDDVIIGTAGPDTLLGKGGNDRICGGEGDDAIDGGAGNDRLFGEGGNDAVTGGPGIDTVDGGAGNDTLKGGTEADSCNGQGGTDTANSSCEVMLNVP